MSIVNTITDEYAFWDWLNGDKDSSYYHYFSLEGAKAIQAYMDEYSEDTETGTIEFDPIAWCVEFSEYPSAWDAMEDYRPEDMPTIEKEGIDLVELCELQEQAALEWLEDRTIVIKFDNGTVDGRGIIISEF